MIDFVGISRFLRIALRVAMATIHFHIFRYIFFAFKGSQGTIWHPRDIVLELQGMSN